MARIENWSFVYDPSMSPYTAPEQMKFCLKGNVYGHPIKKDGRYVLTSYIDDFDLETNEIITASGTRYTLGKVDIEYEKAYPNARKRIMKRIKEIKGK